MVLEYFISEVIIFSIAVILFRKALPRLKTYRFLFGIICTTALGVTWDYLAIVFNMWSFNGSYIVKVGRVPILEESLFCVIVPFVVILAWEWSKMKVEEIKRGRANTHG